MKSTIRHWLFATLLGLLYTAPLQAQKYYTKDAKVSFYSKAPLENIEAHNYKGACIIDLQTGKISFSVLMKGFEFAKGLMQEHFNENYVESDKFPKASFNGTVTGKLPLLLTEGKQVWEVDGTMLLHGITRPLKAKIEVSVVKGELTVESSFKLKVTDYEIKIPSLMAEKISDTVLVTVAPAKLQKM